MNDTIYNESQPLRHEKHSDGLTVALAKELRSFHLEDGEPPATEQTINNALKLLDDERYRFYAPNPSVFYGEVQLTWGGRDKQVTLLSDDNGLRIHYWEWNGGKKASAHPMVENADTDKLITALKWLYEMESA